jgi:hypothetical protein
MPEYKVWDALVLIVARRLGLRIETVRYSARYVTRFASRAARCFSGTSDTSPR